MKKGKENDQDKKTLTDAYLYGLISGYLSHGVVAQQSGDLDKLAERATMYTEGVLDPQKVGTDMDNEKILTVFQ